MSASSDRSARSHGMYERKSAVAASASPADDAVHVHAGIGSGPSSSVECLDRILPLGEVPHLIGTS